MRNLISTFLLAGVLCSDAATTLLQRLDPQGYVSDFANILSAEEEQRINEVISELNRKTGAEIAVVTIHSLEGSNIDLFTNQLFNKWGVGQKGRNNGLMFLAAMQERKMRIEVGYGLEGAIPDSRAGQIRRNTITPHFKAGNPGKGILSGVAALAHEVALEYNTTLESTKGQKYFRKPVSPIVYQVGAFAALLGILGTVFCVGFPKKSKRPAGTGSDYWWDGHGGGRYSGGSGYGSGGFGGGGGFSGGCSGGGGSSGGW